MIELIHSSEISVPTRGTQYHISEDSILGFKTLGLICVHAATEEKENVLRIAGGAGNCCYWGAQRMLLRFSWETSMLKKGIKIKIDLLLGNVDCINKVTTMD
jgi:hypothetical protein